MPIDVYDRGDDTAPYPYPWAPRNVDGSPMYCDVPLASDEGKALYPRAGIVGNRYREGGVVPMIRGDRIEEHDAKPIRIAFTPPDVPALTPDQLAAVEGMPEEQP